MENNKKGILPNINEEELHEDGAEAMVLKCAKDPGEPTSQERELHSKTHLPFRSWCRKCVMGRGRDKPHCQKKDGTEKGIPIIGVDFYFIGDPGVETLMLAVSLRDCVSKALFSHVIPDRGMDRLAVRCKHRQHGLPQDCAQK